jgi:hypothetical protein
MRCTIAKDISHATFAHIHYSDSDESEADDDVDDDDADVEEELLLDALSAP